MDKVFQELELSRSKLVKQIGITPVLGQAEIPKQLVQLEPGADTASIIMNI